MTPIQRARNAIGKMLTHTITQEVVIRAMVRFKLHLNTGKSRSLHAKEQDISYSVITIDCKHASQFILTYSSKLYGYTSPKHLIISNMDFNNPSSKQPEDLIDIADDIIQIMEVDNLP